MLKLEPLYEVTSKNVISLRLYSDVNLMELWKEFMSNKHLSSSDLSVATT